MKNAGTPLPFTNNAVNSRRGRRDNNPITPSTCRISSRGIPVIEEKIHSRRYYFDGLEQKFRVGSRFQRAGTLKIAVVADTRVVPGTQRPPGQENCRTHVNVARKEP